MLRTNLVSKKIKKFKIILDTWIEVWYYVKYSLEYLMPIYERECKHSDLYSSVKNLPQKTKTKLDMWLRGFVSESQLWEENTMHGEEFTTVAWNVTAYIENIIHLILGNAQSDSSDPE